MKWMNEKLDGRRFKIQNAYVVVVVVVKFFQMAFTEKLSIIIFFLVNQIKLLMFGTLRMKRKTLIRNEWLNVNHYGFIYQKKCKS